MPIPIAVGAALRATSAAVVGAAAGATIAGAIGTPVSMAFSPVSRRLQYEFNHRTPNIVPEIGDIFKLYQQEKISYREMVDLARCQGVRANTEPYEDLQNKSWKYIVENAAWSPDVSQALDWFYKGKIDVEQLKKILIRNGVNDISYDAIWYRDILTKSFQPLAEDLLVDHWRKNPIYERYVRDSLKEHGYKGLQEQDLILNAPWKLPIDFARQQKILGKLPDGEYQEQLRLSGFVTEHDRLRAESFSAVLSPQESIIAGFRGAYNRTEVTLALMANGLIDERDRNAIREINIPIPGPSDLISFALKEVWDDDVVERFGYDEEFPPQFAYWMKKQGFRDTESAFTENGENFPALSWMRAYWRAHWQVISPGQAYEMLHRLRGNPNDPATWRVQGVKPFTQEDVSTILKIADYPLAFRDRLAALSYRVLSRVDTRRMIETKLMTEAEAIEQFKDQGYVQRDAERLAAFPFNKINQDRRNKAYKLYAKRIEKSYRNGGAEKPELARALYLANPVAGLSPEIFLTLPVGQQTAAALLDDVIQEMINQIDLDIAESDAIASIKAVRASYLRWYTDESETASLLRAVGISEPRIIPMVQRWTIQRISKGRTASVSNLLTWYQKGIASETETLARLLKMGYGQFDAARMISQSNQAIALANAKAQKQVAQTTTQQINAAKKMAKELEAERKRNQKTLTQLGTPAKLAAWYKKGLIDEAAYRRRLAALGAEQSDIDTSVKETEKK